MTLWVLVTCPKPDGVHELVQGVDVAAAAAQRRPRAGVEDDDPGGVLGARAPASVLRPTQLTRVSPTGSVRSPRAGPISQGRSRR